MTAPEETPSRQGGIRYDYAIDPDGDTTANKVLRLVGDDKKVLELGPGPGAMTRYMRERMNCTITAVEFDPELAEHARSYCDRLLVADLDTLDFEQAFGDERFDVIVAADVLEHLKDPWQCLRALRERLTTTGSLVVSIPNVAHNAVIVQLLAGRFPYTEQGLLDQTHLRFFTRHDVEDLLLSTGFLPAIWERNRVPAGKTELGHAWVQASPALRAALADRSDGDTYQFIVKAYRHDEAGMLASSRAECEDLKTRNHGLSNEVDAAHARFDEYEKALENARAQIDATQDSQNEYAKAFHEARDLLVEKDRQLDEVNKAVAASRETIQELEKQRRALEQRLSASEGLVVRTLKRIRNRTSGAE